jgi:hypothetical protein
MTPEEYLELATYYERLAETVRDSRSRYEFRMLADSYMTLAKGIETLDRSAKLLKALERNRVRPPRLAASVPHANGSVDQFEASFGKATERFYLG